MFSTAHYGTDPYFEQKGHPPKQLKSMQKTDMMKIPESMKKATSMPMIPSTDTMWGYLCNNLALVVLLGGVLGYWYVYPKTDRRFMIFLIASVLILFCYNCWNCFATGKQIEKFANYPFEEVAWEGQYWGTSVQPSSAELFPTQEFA